MRPELDTALKIFAGVGGATALFAAILAFVGWQYTTAYYETLGMPSSALDLSTEDYLFATRQTIIFAFFGLSGILIGLMLGLLISLPSTLKNFEKVAVILPATVPFLIVSFPELKDGIGTAGDSLGWEYGLKRVTASGLFFIAAFILVFLVTSSIRFQEPRGSVRSFLLISALAAGSLFAVIAFVPEYLGDARAQHQSRHPEDFPRASFVVNGSVGLPPLLDVSGPLGDILAKLRIAKSGERSVPVAKDAVEVTGEPTPCNEFVAAEKKPSHYCLVGNVVVILHNNNTYFVTENQPKPADERVVYPIPDSRVIRMQFYSQGEFNREGVPSNQVE